MQRPKERAGSSLAKCKAGPDRNIADGQQKMKRTLSFGVGPFSLILRSLYCREKIEYINVNTSFL